jgi:FKBP-type peptidyl-prolyl cis-trans isomerase 2
MINNVADGNLVKVHYTLTVDGKVYDSTRGKEPFEFQVGMHQVIPGFEKALKDMKVGEIKSFQLSPDDGYGPEDSNCFREVSRGELPTEMKPEVGMELYAHGPDNQTIPVRIKEIKEDVVVMNFNHPLAGKTLNYEVEIMDIKQGA